MTNERNRFNCLRELSLGIYKNKIKLHYFPKNEAFYYCLSMKNSKSWQIIFSETRNDNSVEYLHKMCPFVLTKILVNMHLIVKMDTT